MTARRTQIFVKLIDNGGFADAGVSREEDELRPVAGYNAVKGSEQGVDFGFSPVQFLWDQQSVGRVLFAKRKLVDAMVRFPFSKATPKIACGAGRCLISLLSRLGEQLHDDCRNRARNTIQSLRGWCRLSCDMTVHQFHRIGRREWKISRQELVKRDAESIEIAPRIDRAIHSPGLFGGHVGEGSG